MTYGAIQPFNAFPLSFRLQVLIEAFECNSNSYFFCFSRQQNCVNILVADTL